MATESEFLSTDLPAKLPTPAFMFVQPGTATTVATASGGEQLRQVDILVQIGPTLAWSDSTQHKTTFTLPYNYFLLNTGQVFDGYKGESNYLVEQQTKLPNGFINAAGIGVRASAPTATIPNEERQVAVLATRHGFPELGSLRYLVMNTHDLFAQYVLPFGELQESFETEIREYMAAQFPTSIGIRLGQRIFQDDVALVMVDIENTQTNEIETRNYKVWRDGSSFSHLPYAATTA